MRTRAGRANPVRMWLIPWKMLGGLNEQDWGKNMAREGKEGTILDSL